MNLLSSFLLFALSTYHPAYHSLRRKHTTYGGKPPDTQRGTTVAQAKSSRSLSISDASRSYHILKDVKRIFCLSDLHTDHVANLEWLQKRMQDGEWKESDLLVVAGDISHDFDILRKSIRYMTEAGCQVFFVWGNHEAWLNRKTDTFDSLEKLHRVYETCREEGVLVDPCYVPGQNPLWLLPIPSWYDGTLSFSEELCKGFGKWPWVDFARCTYPDFPPNKDRIPSGLVEYFHKNNKSNVELVSKALRRRPKQSLMTVSHFLPSKRCLPDWKDLNVEKFKVDEWLDHGAGEMSAKFAKVAGSRLIDDQIRSLSPLAKKHVHIFGHSHRPKDFEFDRIRYVHNPLGKPRERQLYMVSPDVDFQLLWDVDRGEIPGNNIIRLWEEQGGGKEMLLERLEQVRPGRYQKR